MENKHKTTGNRKGKHTGNIEENIDKRGFYVVDEIVRVAQNRSIGKREF